MKTCIAVQDGETGLQLAFITGIELYQKLQTMNLLMFEGKKAPAGNGKADNPYIINSFNTLLGYIDLRDKNPQGKLYFKFFDVDMTQNGNEDSAGTQKYYIALKGQESLSYPAMARALTAPTPNSGISGANVKAAVGVSAANETEMLAIAALFIAEGRRSRPSLMLHLMLCDLISDQVTYGGQKTKVRTLKNAIDKPIKQKAQLYAGITNIGDSPMAQNDAVDQANKTNMSATTGSVMAKSRYFDKTVSLCAQWIEAYYESEKLILKACSPTDNVAETDAANEVKKTAHIDTKKEALRAELKQNNSPAGLKNKWPKQSATLERNEKAKLNGVKPQVLVQIQNMLTSKLNKALAGEASGFKFAPKDITFDTKTLIAVLNAA